MLGVSLNQLLSFMQIVQQQTSSSGFDPAFVPAFSSLSLQQRIELLRLGQTCSQNKQANMAYVGIGNRKRPLVQIGHLHNPCQHTPDVQPDSETTPCSAKEQQSPAEHKWRPHGKQMLQSLLHLNTINASRLSKKVAACYGISH